MEKLVEIFQDITACAILGVFGAFVMLALVTVTLLLSGKAARIVNELVSLLKASIACAAFVAACAIVFLPQNLASLPWEASLYGGLAMALFLAFFGKKTVFRKKEPDDNPSETSKTQ